MASRSQTPDGVAAPTARPRTRKTAAKADTQATPLAASAVPDDLRRQWIAEAAYFLAERRGFCNGSAEADWLQAEADIDRMLASPPH